MHDSYAIGVMERGAQCFRSARHTPRLMHDQCAEPLSIHHLASKAGVFETQVIGSFTTVVRPAPHAYPIAWRVERAKQLILQGHAPVEVAFLAGFSDQSHLSRHFRRMNSLPPGQFAKALHWR